MEEDGVASLEEKLLESQGGILCMKNTSSTKAMTKVLVKSSKTMRQQYTSTDLVPVQGKRVNGS